MDDLVKTSEVGEDLIEAKSHSTPMEMNEFVQWMNTNLGAIGLREALEETAFMLCCVVIAEDVAKATLRLRERLPNNTSRALDPSEHPIAEMLALEPNRRHSWYNFKEMMALWQCFTQNSMAGVIRSVGGDVLELIPFQTNRVTEKVYGSDVFYDVSASTMQEQALLGSAFHTFHERDMIHVRGRMFDGMDGYSTMVAGRRALETARAINEFRTNLFDEEGQIRGVFTRDKPGAMDDAAFQRLKQQFRILMQRLRANVEPVVLEDGVTFESISSKPDEMELTKQFIVAVEEQCRLLRVPPHKVFQMDGAKYENLETQEKMYVGDTLVPFCKRFEERYAATLLTRKERLKYFFEHDRGEMTLRDTKNETERAIRSLERGAITFDEFRGIVGFNPLPKGQGAHRIIPVNMNVVDENGTVIISGSAAKGSDKQPEDEADKTESKAGLRLVK